MPRVGLTRDRVAAVAADLVDETGFETLSLSAVAKRVGVSQPALYKHVPGLDALRRDVAVLAVGELAGILHDARAGLHGRDALRAVCAAYRGYATAHPGRAAASVRAPAPGDADHATVGAAAAGELLAVLADYGIGDDEEGVHAVRQIRACLHGFVTLEAAGGFGLPESVDETFARLVDALDVAFAARTDGR
ncbi:MAG: WHG domain-containing protein [Actinobacteria bacterium]|nr:WHG domain-containing protein [Actinomycetota bacterium]